MTARKQNKTWKGYAVIDVDDNLVAIGKDTPHDEYYIRWHATLSPKYDMRSVTISLSKPKRQARKVK